MIFTWGTKTSISLSLCALYVLSMQAAIQTLQCVCTRLKESGTALAWPPLSRSSLLVSKMNLCYMYICALSSKKLIFLRKSDCLGCAVLPCLVCLTLLAFFFLPSHLSLKHVHVHVCTLSSVLISLKHVHNISSVQLTNMFR